MSHIAVERNRRRQMNDHLKVLRSLTPAFYIKRGDQASIIGGAIEFIKELQTLLESLEAKKKRKQQHMYSAGGGSLSPATPSPSPRSLLTTATATTTTTPSSGSPAAAISGGGSGKLELAACCNSPVADVEAKISGSNVLLRTLSRRIPGHALHIIALLESLHLEVLHLNITTMEEEDTVLHSLVLKIGLECQLSVEDLAFQVHKTFCCHQEQQDLIYSSMPEPI